MLSIYEYTEYRKYLADYYQHKKRTEPHFSHRVFLQKAGLKGPNFLKNVIDGKKNLSSISAQQFARALELTKRETEYFANLVFYNQAKTPEKKHFFFEKLSSFLRVTDTANVNQEQYEYFSHWYHVAVREYIHAHPFSGEYGTMIDNIIPRISEHKAREAVALLERLGMIFRGPDGFYKVTDKILTNDSDINMIGAHNIHKTMLDIHKFALETIPIEKRYFRTMLGCCSEKAFEQFKMEMDAMRKRILEIVENDHDEKKLYCIGMQLYPMEKQKKKYKRKTT